MINLKVRAKNKTFWLAMVPAVLLLAQQVAALFGAVLDFSGLQGQLLDIIETVFLLAAILGVVVDPTTAGISDSSQAMTYTTPKEDDAHV